RLGLGLFARETRDEGEGTFVAVNRDVHQALFALGVLAETQVLGSDGEGRSWPNPTAVTSLFTLARNEGWDPVLGQQQLGAGRRADEGFLVGNEAQLQDVPLPLLALARIETDRVELDVLPGMSDSDEGLIEDLVVAVEQHHGEGQLDLGKWGF